MGRKRTLKKDSDSDSDQSMEEEAINEESVEESVKDEHYWEIKFNNNERFRGAEVDGKVDKKKEEVDHFEFFPKMLDFVPKQDTFFVPNPETKKYEKPSFNNFLRSYITYVMKMEIRNSGMSDYELLKDVEYIQIVAFQTHYSFVHFILVSKDRCFLSALSHKDFMNMQRYVMKYLLKRNKIIDEDRVIQLTHPEGIINRYAHCIFVDYFVAKESITNFLSKSLSRAKKREAFSVKQHDQFLVKTDEADDADDANEADAVADKADAVADKADDSEKADA